MDEYPDNALIGTFTDKTSGTNYSWPYFLRFYYDKFEETRTSKSGWMRCFPRSLRCVGSRENRSRQEPPGPSFSISTLTGSLEDRSSHEWQGTESTESHEQTTESELFPGIEEKRIDCPRTGLRGPDRDQPERTSPRSTRTWRILVELA